MSIAVARGAAEVWRESAESADIAGVVPAEGPAVGPAAAGAADTPAVGAAGVAETPAVGAAGASETPAVRAAGAAETPAVLVGGRPVAGAAAGPVGDTYYIHVKSWS